MNESFLRDTEGKILKPVCSVLDAVHTGWEIPCGRTAEWVVTFNTGVRSYMCSHHLQQWGYEEITDLDNVRIFVTNDG